MLQPLPYISSSNISYEQIIHISMLQPLPQIIINQIPLIVKIFTVWSKTTHHTSFKNVTLLFVLRSIHNVTN